MMIYKNKNQIFNKNIFYLIIPITNILINVRFFYPRIYGADAFGVIWMAQALRNGALTSENTWLIHPASYFGYYPFSHYPIGIPFFLAMLISIIETVSFGVYGLTEAILFYNIILILIIYKAARNLGKTLFDEEWSRFIFVAAILLSPTVFQSTLMTVSTRIVITLMIIILLDLNLNLIIKDYKLNKLKFMIRLIILFLVGAFAHRLWMGALLILFPIVFSYIIRNNLKLKRIMIFSILPLSIIAFFIGLRIFAVDPKKILSPWLDNSTLFGLTINLCIHYALDIGLILFFFPIGILFTISHSCKLLNIFDYELNQKSKNENQKSLNMKLYLLLTIPLFFFMSPTFYATTIFLPILIIFSLFGLIYLKNFILSISRKNEYILPIILLSLSIGYSLLYVELILSINLTFIFILFIIIILSYLSFLIINFLYRKFSNAFLPIDLNQLRKSFELFTIIISILIFTLTTALGRLETIESSPYPWENRYLTDEEIEIINFFEDKKINGLIFVVDGHVANRIAGVGFLPVFYNREFIGKSIYYGFINSTEVYNNTYFSLSDFERLNFYNYNKTDPIRSVFYEIIRLNITISEERTILRINYNTQYIISIKPNFSHISNHWILIRSLNQSELTPIFSTSHFLIWEIS